MKKLRFMRVLIFLISFIVIINLLWFIEHAVKQYNQVNESWAKYSDTESMIVETVLELNAHLGYGGLIHDFKNYVMRDEQKYVLLLDHDIAAVKLKLNTLKPYFKNQNELQAIKAIHDTIDEYAQKIEIVSQMHLKGVHVEKIDSTVKVSDQAALKALKIIQEETVKRSVQVQLETDLLMEKADSFLAKGRLLAFPFIFLTLLLFYYIREMKKSNDEVLKSQKWADTLLDTSPEATIIVNRLGKIIRTNKMAIDFFGYNNEELLNMTVEQLIPDRLTHKHNKMRENFFNNPSVRLMEADKQLYAKLKNGKESIVEISLSMAGEGNNSDMVAIATIRDITEREENKRQTVQAKNLAESALKQLEQVKDSLVESEKMAALGELVAGVAHEINTPIGNALASSTYINDETNKISKLYDNEDLSEDELHEYFSDALNATKLIENNLVRAADLINSFKRMAVDQSAGKQRSFGLDEYIREILLSIHPLIKKYNVTITQHCDKNLTMNSYPGALSQCISNLIINAVVHGFDAREEGFVNIRVNKIQKTNSVIIDISDNGKGIAEHLHKKIFEPFYTTRRNAGGSGLGMQIVYNLVTHNLGGKILLKSSEGDGTTFTLELPREFKLSQTKIK